MNNLASLKSQLLYEYSQADQNLWKSQNFYGHHNMPPRTHLKSSQAKFKSNLKPIIHIIPSLPESRPFQNIKANHIGRDLFNVSQKSDIPGPGYYDQPLKRYSSHGYIKKEEEHILKKISRKRQKQDQIIKSRGPGLYNPEIAFNRTSKSKSITQGKIFSGNFIRKILAKQKMDNLYLVSIATQNKLQGAQNGIHYFQFPSIYQSQNLDNSTIQYSQRRHKIVPGPGFYQWDKCLQAKINKSKTKPTIQYKFVYGHPS